MARTYSNSEFENILIYFTNSIFGQNTEEEIAWDLAKNCISQLGFEDCVVYFVDEDNQLLVQKAAYGPKNPEKYEIADPIFIPIGNGITGSVAQNGKSELIADTSQDRRYIVDDEQRYSEITVPIFLDGKVYGVIDCEHPEKHFFTTQHLRILEAISTIYAIKISKVRAERASKEKEQHLLNIQKELLQLKVEALRTQMNPHFLFNAINSVQYFITIEDKPSALRFLSVLSKLIRYYLNNFEKDELTIDNEQQFMKWYMELQKLRYVEKFEYTFQTSIDNHSEMLKIPSMILGSLTESILENSLFDNNDKSLLKIKTKVDKGFYHVIALFTSQIKPAPLRAINYREELGSWEEQINLLNRLKNLGIIKEISKRSIGKNKKYLNLIHIKIPTIDI